MYEFLQNIKENYQEFINKASDYINTRCIDNATDVSEELTRLRTIFNLLVYGTEAVSNNAYLQMEFSNVTDNRVTIQLNTEGASQVFKFTNREPAIYKEFAERIGAWLYDFVMLLSEQVCIDKVQAYFDSLLTDAKLNYKVLFCVGHGLKDVTDDSITIGLRSTKLQEVLQFVENGGGNPEQDYEVLSTFKQCLHPLELLHIDTRITNLLGLYTQQSYQAVLYDMYAHSLKSEHDGVVFVYSKEDGCFALLRVQPLTILEYEKHYKTESTQYAVRDNTKPSRAEQAKNETLLLYTYYMQPKNSYLESVDVGIERIISGKDWLR